MGIFNVLRILFSATHSHYRVMALAHIKQFIMDYRLWFDWISSEATFSCDYPVQWNELKHAILINGSSWAAAVLVFICMETDRQQRGWGFESNLTHVRQALDLILIIHFHIVNHEISTAKPIESSSDKLLLSNSLGQSAQSCLKMTFRSHLNAFVAKWERSVKSEGKMCCFFIFYFFLMD